MVAMHQLGWQCVNAEKASGLMEVPGHTGWTVMTGLLPTGDQLLVSTSAAHCPFPGLLHPPAGHHPGPAPPYPQA
jgi:hypothetical protein